MLHDMYSGFDFSINSTKANDCLAQNSDDLSLSGLSQYWLVEKDLIQKPNSFELLAFWRHYHSTAERIMQNGNEKQHADFYEEAELTSEILESEAKYFLDRFFTVRRLICHRLGIKSEQDVEQNNIDNRVAREYGYWKSQVKSLKLSDLKDYLEYIENDYLLVLGMQANLQNLLSEKRSSDLLAP